MRFLRESMVCDAGDQGQSTVEYALVLAAFVSMIVGLGVLWRFVSGGALVEHAVSSASHCLVGVVSGVVADAFMV